MKEKEGFAIIKKKSFAIFLMAILMLGVFIQAFPILFGGLVDKIGPKVFITIVLGFIFYKFEKTRLWIGGAFVLYFVLTSQVGAMISNIKWIPILCVVAVVWFLKEPKKKKS